MRVSIAINAGVLKVAHIEGNNLSVSQGSDWFNVYEKVDGNFSQVFGTRSINVIYWFIDRA